MAQNSGALAGLWRWTSTFEKPDGGCLVRSESNRYDTVRQVVHSQHRYDEYEPGGSLTRTLLHRLDLAYLYAGDIRRLMMQSGFQSVRIAGGFDGRAFGSDADELVVEAALD